jgi:hypothetical protein
MADSEPSFDAQNRQANETTIAINPVTRHRGAGANDYRMVSVHGDGWLGFYVSADGGDSWFNTMVPGFTTDTSANGRALARGPTPGRPGGPVRRSRQPLRRWHAFNRDLTRPTRTPTRSPSSPSTGGNARHGGRPAFERGG